MFLLHLLTYTPLSAIKALARRELQCSEQMGKSNWAEASGLLSWPSSSCQHAKDFKSRIFKITCVDWTVSIEAPLDFTGNCWAGNKYFCNPSPTDTCAHSLGPNLQPTDWSCLILFFEKLPVPWNQGWGCVCQLSVGESLVWPICSKSRAALHSPSPAPAARETQCTDRNLQINENHVCLTASEASCQWCIANTKCC